MNRKNDCIACRFKRDGVKTRRALVHTCGKYIKELPPVNPNKEYYVSCDLYDNTYGPGAILVMSKSEDGKTLKVEYSTNTTVKDFKREVLRIAQYYNAVPIYDEVTERSMNNS